MAIRERTRELLRLARDACTGIAAFMALRTGEVTVVASPGERTRWLDEQVARLAERALAEGAPSGARVWTLELPTETSAERLSCVAAPVVRAGALIGVLGVVDLLLLDLDGELEQILVRIAADLADTLPRPAAQPALAPESAPATRPVSAGEGRRAEQLLGAMSDHLPEGVVVVREDGTILYVNRTFATLAHRSVEDLVGTDLRDVLSDDLVGPGPLGTGQLLGIGTLGRRLLLHLPGGRLLPVDVRARRIELGMAGDHYAALVRDARQPLLGPIQGAGVAILDEILDCIDDAIAVCDDAERVVLANRAASRLFLPSDGELAGRPFPFSTEVRTPEGTVVRYEEHPVVRALHGTTVVAEHMVVEGPKEHRHHLLVSARPFGIAGSAGVLVIAREITAQLDQEARLMQLALHDPLTGLANRYLLLDYLQRTFRQVRSRGGAMALLYLDLDDFKSINDTHGHDVGDEVLVAVAGRLQGTTRGSDLVARLSGDEFVIVATAASFEPTSVKVLVARLQRVLGAPYNIRDHLLTVGASVGWVIADPLVEDPMTLLVRADEEMYRDKQERRLRREGEQR